MLKIVSNSSPLIHLAKIDQLNLLEKYYQKIIIPEIVYKECVADGREKEECVKIQKANWIEIKNPENSKMITLLKIELDEGEAEAIALALEIGADLLLLDDSEGRVKAKHLGLAVAGTIGVLLKEKKIMGTEFFKKALLDLKNSGFWISKKLEDQLLK